MEANSDPKVRIAEQGQDARLIVPKDFERAPLKLRLCKTRIKHVDIDLNQMPWRTTINCIADAKAAEPMRFAREIAASAHADHGVEARVQGYAPTDGQAQKPNTQQKEADQAKVDEDGWACRQAQLLSRLVNSEYTLSRRSPYLGKTRLLVESAFETAA